MGFTISRFSRKLQLRLVMCIVPEVQTELCVSFEILHIVAFCVRNCESYELGHCIMCGSPEFGLSRVRGWLQTCALALTRFCGFSHCSWLIQTAHFNSNVFWCVFCFFFHYSWLDICVRNLAQLTSGFVRDCLSLQLQCWFKNIENNCTLNPLFPFRTSIKSMVINSA